MRCLTFNLPEVLNSIAGRILAALNEALKAANCDSSVRVLVITGAGRGFRAGLDLKRPNGARSSATLTWLQWVPDTTQRGKSVR
ncbi:MAG: enoyl-CoA hydratase-related protein [Pseudomonadota bacterium]